MSATKAVTLRLPTTDFERLAEKARQSGVRPGTYARMILHQHLQPGYDAATLDKANRALDRLRELRLDLPEVDAVEVVRDGRNDLETRGEV
ncbi:MAG TPA: hypothetical protein VKU40_15060 [Thermoanaerobaculia bacterium]|nr:hypothetical protein [Thermoanaerobaculia bacterium]